MSLDDTLPNVRELLPDDVGGVGSLAFALGVDELLDSIYYDNLVSEWDDTGCGRLAISVYIIPDAPLAIELPFLPGLQVTFGSVAGEPPRVDVDFEFTGPWSLTVSGTPIGITFPPEVLADPAHPDQGTSIGLTATLQLDDALNVTFTPPTSIDVPRSRVAGTSLQIEISGLHLDLDGGGNRGIVADRAVLVLPREFVSGEPPELVFDRLAIGTAGISGSVSWTVPAAGQPGAAVWTADDQAFSGLGTGTLFDMPFSLRRISVTLEGSVPVEADAVVHLFIPYWEQVIALEVSFGSSGDAAFKIAGADAQPEGVKQSPPGLLVLRRDGFAQLELDALTIAKQGDTASIVLSGSLTPLFGGTWPSVKVKALTIDSRGHVSIDGGWLDLDKQQQVDFGGVMLELSKIGFGNEADGTRWIGFSGGLRLSGELPLSGTVEGLRIKLRDGVPSIQLEGASVAFTVPNSVDFSGHVSYLDDGTRKGFLGGGRLTILPLSMTLSSEIVVGRNTATPPYSFFYLFVDGQFPVGIPLSSTGAALFGFSGLFGANMEPARDAPAPWFDGWYMMPPIGIANATKWRDARDALWLGAGVALGTASDDGHAVNGHLMLVLGLPGPTILLEGRGAFLQDRARTAADPPLRALAVLDAAAGQFLIHMSGEWPYASSADLRRLIHVTGGAEAFFDYQHPDAWHLFLGQKTPSNKRIEAEILKLLKGSSFLMLFSDHVELGAHVGYDRSWKYGPVNAHLAAWMDGDGQLSWKPSQLKGSLELYGDLHLKAFGFSTGFTVDATVTAQAPSPYRVDADVDVKWDLPRPFHDQHIHASISWREDVAAPFTIPLARVGVEHLKTTEKWPLVRVPNYDVQGDGLWRDDSEPSAIEVSLDDTPCVPLDGKLVLSFARPVWDDVHVGTNPSSSPGTERSGGYDSEHRLVEITLERKAKGSAGGWQTVTRRAATNPDAGSDTLWGVWLAADAASEGGITPTKLMLHAQDPFAYARESSDDGFFDRLIDAFPNLAWARVDPPTPITVGPERVAGGAEVMVPWARLIDQIPSDTVVARGRLLRVRNGRGRVALDLGVHTRSDAALFFPVPIVECWLDVTSIPEQRKAPEDISFAYRTYLGKLPTSEGVASIARSGGRVTLRLPPTDIVVMGGTLAIDGLAYITAEEARRADDETSIAASTTDPPPATFELFEPTSYYRIKIGTTTRRRPASGGDWVVVTFDELAYFQTAGPPGVGASDRSASLDPAEAPAAYPAGGDLSDLREYVESTSPAPDEAPVYRAYDLEVRFNEAYVEDMYLSAASPLTLDVVNTSGRRLVLDFSLSSTGWRDVPDPPDPPPPTQFETAVRCATSALERAATIAEVAVAVTTELPRGTTLQLAQTPALPKARELYLAGSDMLLPANQLLRATVEAAPASAVASVDGRGRVSALRAVDADGLRNAMAANAQTRSVIVSGDRIAVHAPPNVEGAATDLAGLVGLAADRSPSASVFRWSFTSSRFSCFVHHVQSFAGYVRNRQAAGALRERVPVSAPMLTQAFDLDASPRSEIVTVSRLVDDSGAFGILIESPEPFDPQRVTIGVAWSADSPIRPNASAVDIRICDANPVEGWVDLVVLRDIANLKIAVASVLDRQVMLPAASEGTIMRVLTRGAAAGSRERMRFECDLPFNAPNDQVTLVDDEGNVVQTFALHAVDTFAEIATWRWLQNADRTRWFGVSSQDGAPPAVLADGYYRLTWQLRRTVPGLPVRRRCGDAEPEVTAMLLALRQA